MNAEDERPADAVAGVQPEHIKRRHSHTTCALWQRLSVPPYDSLRCRNDFRKGAPFIQLARLPSNCFQDSCGPDHCGTNLVEVIKLRLNCATLREYKEVVEHQAGRL